MSDSSVDDKKDETKPVLDHNFPQYYPNPGYYYPPYDHFPGSYGQPYLGYPNPNMPQCLYFYPNYQSDCYDNNNNNINTTPQPELSNVAPPSRKSLTFCRVLFCLIFIIILGIIITLVVIWWKFLPYEPRFEVVSFVVNSFEISNSSKLRADWEIEMNVYNPNKKVDIKLEHIATSLMYKYTLLETSFSAPFKLNKKSEATIRADFDIPNSNHKEMGGLVVNDIARDRRKGHLSFDLRIEAKILHIEGNKSRRRKTVYVICEDLNLEFKNSSSLPNWDGYIVECTFDDG
uniref:Protein YLS9-like n=3 Tax=Nicotiana TaxID=4085 RepID=A0A1S4CE53_TOBAC|nr:PREDICTED: uncharacterized protein LOC104249968 [Nicotiana sylvestris]XP_016499413.1 PREDICTED: uncharacterized protein LOC107818017 [Nicotiana tabacum]